MATAMTGTLGNILGNNPAHASSPAGARPFIQANNSSDEFDFSFNYNNAAAMHFNQNLNGSLCAIVSGGSLALSF